MSTTSDPPFERLVASGLAGEIEFLTARARSIGTVLANRGLAPLGLRVRSYSVLALSCGDLRPTQRVLAEFLRLDPSQIVSIVDELEAAGLVRRDVDPADRRTKVVVATDDGEALYREAAAATRSAEDAALAQLTTAERDELRRLLARIAFTEPPALE